VAKQQEKKSGRRRPGPVDSKPNGFTNMCAGTLKNLLDFKIGVLVHIQL